MSRFSSELRKHGMEPTGRESPFHEEGMLWSNSHELVCDETALVIRGSETVESTVAELSGDVPRYSNSDRVILPGGHASNYEWGKDDGAFVYDRDSQ